jgi:hypothetical protein
VSTALWTKAVDRWFAEKFIYSVTKLSDNRLLLAPGNIDGFGFHFSRDLIPIVDGDTASFRSELVLKFLADKKYELSFLEWESLSPAAKAVFNAILTRASTQLARNGGSR